MRWERRGCPSLTLGFRFSTATVAAMARSSQGGRTGEASTSITHASRSGLLSVFVFLRFRGESGKSGNGMDGVYKRGDREDANKGRRWEVLSLSPTGKGKRGQAVELRVGPREPPTSPAVLCPRFGLGKSWPFWFVPTSHSYIWVNK
jgi:hypothetical protein